MLSLSFDRLDELYNDPLRITLVGHTEHGKTSIVRTLTENATFGEILGVPCATKQIAGKRIHINHRDVMRIYDTPGFERVSDAFAKCGPQAKIEDLEEYFKANRNCGQEREVLGHIGRETDIILYVVDVSQEPKQKYRDEFQMLLRCMKPMITLMNFLAVQPNYRDAWEEFFARNGHYEHVPYDAHARILENEDKLYRRMGDLLKKPLHKQFLETWISHIKRKQDDARQRSASAIAVLMLDAAAYCPQRLAVRAADRKQVEVVLELEFRREIDRREAEAHSAIAEAFAFTDDQIANCCAASDGTPVWRESLWIKSRLIWASVTTAAAAGAMTGAVVDLFVGGSSFLLGTLIGGAIGAVGGAVGARFYKTSYCEATGVIELRISDPTLTLLLSRAIALTSDLQQRGHAKEIPEQVRADPPKPKQEQLKQILEILAEARQTFHEPAPRVDQEKPSVRRKYGDLLARLQLPIDECLIEVNRDKS